nr:serine hydrolase [Saccharopolyspora sp. HNM0983]
MYTASVVKVLVAVDLLNRRGDRLSADERELLDRALTISDDEALNALWSVEGGAGAVDRIAARAGMTGTRPPQNPAQWGETVSTARDIARLFGFVASGVDAEHRDLVVDALRDTRATAADGFDQRFGVGTLPGSAAKPGWMCCQDGRVTLHSAGFADPEQRFVVVLMSDPPAELGYEGAQAQLDDAAEAVAEELR